MVTTTPVSVCECETTSPQPIARDSMRALATRYYVLAGRVVLLDSPARMYSHRHILCEIAQPRTARQDWSPARIVASRAYNPRWPLILKRLYASCVQGYASWSALIDADLEDPAGLPRSQTHSQAFYTASAALSGAWRALEIYAGPLFDQWDQENPGAALVQDQGLVADGEGL